MGKYTLSKDELLTHLSDQIEFMINSAISYDNDFEGEAKRMAANIRILVYDTTSCSALLTQLKKMDILFYDSAYSFNPENPLPSTCLIMQRFTKQATTDLRGDYVAPLDNLSPARSKNKKVSFGRWWNRNIVFKDITGNLFTRKDLVLTVADKEGGAHVDPKLDQAYVNLTKFNSLGWKVYVGGKAEDLDNPVPPSIRQITHEVLKTLKDGVLDLFPNKTVLLEKFEKYEKHCQTLNQ